MADHPSVVYTHEVSLTYCGRHQLQHYQAIRQALDALRIKYERLDFSPTPAEAVERAFNALGLDYGDGLGEWAEQIVLDFHEVDSLDELPQTRPLSMYFFAVTRE